jgi:hypothetical protein
VTVTCSLEGVGAQLAEKRTPEDPHVQWRICDMPITISTMQKAAIQANHGTTTMWNKNSSKLTMPLLGAKLQAQNAQ